jgi:hypothetical protein
LAMLAILSRCCYTTRRHQLVVLSGRRAECGLVNAMETFGEEVSPKVRIKEETSLLPRSECDATHRSGN